MPVEHVPEPDGARAEDDEEQERRRHPPLREHERVGGGDRGEHDEPGEGLEPPSRGHRERDRGEGGEQDRGGPGREELEPVRHLEEEREADRDRRCAVEPGAREVAPGGVAIRERDPDARVDEPEPDPDPGREPPALGERAQEEGAGEDEERAPDERHGARDRCGILPQHGGGGITRRSGGCGSGAHPARGRGGEPALEDSDPLLHFPQGLREFRDLRLELGRVIGHVVKQTTDGATIGTRSPGRR